MANRKYVSKTKALNVANQVISSHKGNKLSLYSIEKVAMAITMVLVEPIPVDVLINGWLKSVNLIGAKSHQEGVFVSLAKRDQEPKFNVFGVLNGDGPDSYMGNQVDLHHGSVYGHERDEYFYVGSKSATLNFIRYVRQVIS